MPPVDRILVDMLSPRASLYPVTFFLYVGIVRSRYALFFYYVHCHPLMTHGSTNRRRTCIDILDDDSLLNIFYHCRPLLLLEGGDVDRIGLWDGRWEYDYWWYKLAQVCRRWRRLIITSPSYLGISLVCRPGTPVADMLGHSPPFPLIIDHLYLHDNISAEDEETTRLALGHHDRVRRICLQMDTIPLMRLLAAVDGAFPLLEYLYICPLTWPDTDLSLPSTLRAPHLRHLVLDGFAFPIGSSLPVGLVTLSLELNRSANFSLNVLLQQLSLMPHLETFRLSFCPVHSNHDVERQLLQMPLSTHVTLPALRWFGFEGVYMEAVLPRITMPLLKVTEIVSMMFSHSNLPSSILFTLQSMCETENPRLSNVRVTFYDKHIVVTMCLHKRTDMPTLRVRVLCVYPAFALWSIVHVLSAIKAVLTEVESLTVEEKSSSRYAISEFGLSIPNKLLWRELLKPFNKVQSVHVSGGDLIEALSGSLRPYNGKSAIELLPMLRVLSCPKGSHIGKSCRSFITDRRRAGSPVTISHR